MTSRGRAHAIDHVELEAAPGVEDELRWFYGELIGLAPLPDEQPDGAAERLLRFRSARVELHITIREDAHIESVDRRATFEVPSLDEAMQTLNDRRYRFSEVQGLGSTDRSLVLFDPGGNRIALRRLWPASPL